MLESGGGRDRSIVGEVEQMGKEVMREILSMSVLTDILEAVGKKGEFGLAEHQR